MYLSNDPDTAIGDPPGEHNQRIKDWILYHYRERYPAESRNEVHLSTCPDVEITYDLFDGWCNNDDCSLVGPCERAILEAVLECRHGVRREYEDWFTDRVEEILAKLEAYERREYEQRGKQVIRIGTLEPGPAVMPMIVVYYDTLDYPSCYVVRQHDIGPGVVAVHPSPILVTTSLQEVRGVVPGGMVRINRLQEDDPKIVEVYI